MTTPPEPTLFDRLKQAQKCTTAFDSGQMDCDFDLGSLHFEIADVGAPMGGVSIYKADSYNGFHLSYGVLHGCLIIKPGFDTPAPLSDIAFVSLATGGVHRDWRACKSDAARKRRRS